MSTSDFYKQIKSWKLPIADALFNENFSLVPSEWYVIIADVQNSTAAVAAGKHNDVNLVAAGSLIAALNIAKAHDIEIPFFFGGDGGAILIPPVLKDDVLCALNLHNENSTKVVGLRLHIGCVSVNEILALGGSISIAKVQLGGYFRKAVVLGNGLKIAEQLIKRSPLGIAPENINKLELNLSGLECRWDKVKPPLDESEVVCYLIEARDQLNQAKIYREVLTKIDELFGPLESRSPLSVARLRLLANLQKIDKETRLKFGQLRFAYFIRALLENIVGFFYFRFNLKLGPVRGREYLAQIIANADTLTIDGRINTIISGKKEKRDEFIAYLNRLELRGDLIYGHHISKESVMTCYIENMNARHVHFIDGSDGGYTEASKELKSKSFPLVS